MRELATYWKETKEKVEQHEEALINTYIGFLKEVARSYLKQGRRVFFRENRVVHWGEGNFGSLIIEGDEEVKEVFGDYIAEIRFGSKLDEKALRGYIEVKEANLETIKYEL